MNITTLYTTLKNIINENNTTTSSYDISSSLDVRVKSVFAGSSGLLKSIPIIKNQYPAIIIELNSSTDNFERLGKSSRRNVLVDVDIYGITETTLTESNKRENADLECLQLAENLENLFRNKISLSSTVKWARINNSEYSNDIRERTYNSICKLNLEVEYDS